MANDFTAKTDQITIRAGQRMPFDSDGNPETISIATTEDTDYEGDETFTLTFSATNAAVTAGRTAIGTILNDDLLTVSLAFADFAFGRNYLATEGKPINIRVSTTRNVIDDLEVALTLPDGASEGLSFALPDGSNSVTIPSGKSEIVSAVNITTTTSPGGVAPGATASFTLAIATAADRYNIARAPNNSFSFTVRDSDTGSRTHPILSLAGPTSIEEGDTATFTITASHQPFGSNRPISINVEKLSGGNFIRAVNLVEQLQRVSRIQALWSLRYKREKIQ